MKSSLRAAAFVAAAVPFLAAAPAAAQSVAGVWETEVMTRTEVRNGELTGSEPVRVTITLQQTGDSVSGTWQMGEVPGRPPASPRKLNGVVKGTQLTLQTGPTPAKIQRGDSEAYDVEMITTYVLNVSADGLTGTSSSTSTDGSIQSPEQAFNAKRVKS